MESGDEDDAFTMGEREWQKMNRNLSKQGYREGKSEGRDKGRQNSFEQATSLALKNSLKLGQYLGIVEWKLSQAKKPEQRKKLDAIRNQICDQIEKLRALSANNITDLDEIQKEIENIEKLLEEK